MCNKISTVSENPVPVKRDGTPSGADSVTLSVLHETHETDNSAREGPGIFHSRSMQYGGHSIRVNAYTHIECQGGNID